MAIGGMPEVVKAYISDSDLSEVGHIKADLVDGYLADFGKYEYAIDIILNHKILDSLVR